MKGALCCFSVVDGVFPPPRDNQLNKVIAGRCQAWGRVE